MSIKIIEQPTEINKTILMSEMEPLQAGVIVDGTYNGTIVMRTARRDILEIMDLSNPRPNGCWDLGSTLRVRLLDNPITIQIDGK